jgi:hypothetical protein
MKTRLFALVLAAAGAFSTGCTSLNSFQRSEYASMQAQGVAVEEKKPKVAAVLGILPGGGSFYTRQWGMGVVDFLLWPWSIIWDPFVGYSGAEAINYDVSRGHVKQLKAKELAELERKLEDNAITQAEFIELRRSVESRYGFD